MLVIVKINKIIISKTEENNSSFCSELKMNRMNKLQLTNLSLNSSCFQSWWWYQIFLANWCHLILQKINNNKDADYKSKVKQNCMDWTKWQFHTRKEGRKQVKIDFLAIVSLDRERCGYREWFSFFILFLIHLFFWAEK